MLSFQKSNCNYGGVMWLPLDDLLRRNSSLPAPALT